MEIQHAEPPADLFITEMLVNRLERAHDYRREAKVIQTLAMRMADDPEEVLPQFVDLALELTAGVASGISVWEPDDTPEAGVFRWRFLRGSLARFDGATTPRRFSPCGVTLDRNCATLTRQPGRFYNWIADAGVVAPEVLLVPLYVGGGLPFGTLWVVADTEGHFDSDHARLLTELGEYVGMAVQAWNRAPS